MDTRESAQSLRFRHILFALLTILLAIAVITYNPADNMILEGGTESTLGITNAIGYCGATVARFVFYWFGIAAYPLLLMLLAGTVRSVFPRKYKRRGFWIGFFVTALACAALFGLNPAFFIGQATRLGLGHAAAANSALTGGAIGQWLAGPGGEYAGAGVLRGLIGVIGTLIVGWVAAVFGAIMMLFADWRDVGEYVLAARQEHAAAPDDDATIAAEPVKPAKTFAPPAPAAPVEPRQNEENSGEQTARVRRSWLDMFRRKPAEENTATVADMQAEAAAVDLPLNADAAASGNDAPEASRPWRVTPESEPLTSILQKKTQDDSPAVNPADTVNAPPPASYAAANSNLSITVDGGELASAATPPQTSGTAAETAVEPPAAGPTAGKLIEIPGAMPKNVPTGSRQKTPASGSAYKIPTIEMLGRGVAAEALSQEEIDRNVNTLNGVLDSFKIEGRVSGYVIGPRVTRYEIKLAANVPVSKVVGLEREFKMRLMVKSIRIIAPIPGRDAVGVELPNSKSALVSARDVMESDAWRKSKFDIPIVLGKGVSGDPVVMDLARAPHLLVAGATNSGKSVCMNTIIISLLMHFALDDLKLILVDPKRVEYAPYSKLPQLITPVISEASKVPLALRWAVKQMEERYELLQIAGVKKRAEYDVKLASGFTANDKNGKPLPSRMPVLVVIIDELAELMLSEYKADVQYCINRIAQLGRAAGIHIVVATQSPRREVITGTIKANLPTRISFQVSQSIDSRVILDQNGAEELLGLGDMLYYSIGGHIERVQGAMVADSDIFAIAEYIAGQAEQKFDESVVADPEEDKPEAGEAAEPYEDQGTHIDDYSPLVQKYLQPGDDELVARALELIITNRKASTSSIQRFLGIGYNRAATLMDLFEKRGIIGPQQPGGNQREVLIFDGLESGNY
ncbi:MAG: DNA translocase FtsK [Victivallaceae bacterium]|nr:DNA translocase FtsK [Victivallaceae bacterium]